MYFKEQLEYNGASVILISITDWFFFHFRHSQSPRQHESQCHVTTIPTYALTPTTPQTATLTTTLRPMKVRQRKFQWPHQCSPTHLPMPTPNGHADIVTAEPNASVNAGPKQPRQRQRTNASPITYPTAASALSPDPNSHTNANAIQNPSAT
jgi:hypothetical protein